jgi:hypothetical protein
MVCLLCDNYHLHNVEMDGDVVLLCSQQSGQQDHICTIVDRFHHPCQLTLQLHIIIIFQKDG